MILSAIASPIPGSVANCSVDAVLTFIAFSVLLIDRSGARLRLGRLTHPGLSDICATITSVITAVRALAMGRLCFTYASKCLGRLYATAARVCTLLEVQHFQKLRLFYDALSTDFSTAIVENVPKESRPHAPERRTPATQTILYSNLRGELRL
jgi:hypothetical protein